jgi:CubicO group peptidase (beta-lactamase class C family)
LLASGACLAESADTSGQSADAELDKLAAQGFAGSVLVAQGDDVVYARDLGYDEELKTPPSYWIASITKQFVAAGILVLQENGDLDIDDPISRYLDNVPEDKRGITVFQLLTHTSGLNQVYAADGIFDTTEALQALLGQELQSSPGEEFSYANDNYNLLAIILEEVSGKSYEEFLQTEIFEPTGMADSGSWGAPIPDSVFVPPIISPPGDGAMLANWGFRGATGMRASVPDLFSFLQSLDSNQILSAPSVSLLMGNHVQTAGGTEIGFNWFSRHNDNGVYMKFSRGQESFGGNAVIYVYPEQQLTIITATNAGPAETGDGPITGWSRRAHEVLARIYLNGTLTD